MSGANILTVCCLVASAAVAESSPVVTWASYPVDGGEHVLLHGGDWGADPRVEVAGREAAATVLSDTGLVFPLPGNGEAIVEGRVRNGQGVSRPFTLNAPTVWWLQGDGGDASAAGGPRLSARQPPNHHGGVRARRPTQVFRHFRSVGRLCPPPTPYRTIL